MIDMNPTSHQPNLPPFGTPHAATRAKRSTKQNVKRPGAWLGAGLLTVMTVMAAPLIVGCKSGEEPAATDASTATEVAPQRMEGKLRVKDTWVEVAPLVLHDGKMDLFVRCKIVQEDAKKLGREVPPLCYEPTARDQAAITTIRVERWLNLPIAMRQMQMTAEGTHFLVERTGSTYQMLDLVYAVRREGEVRKDELRVIATDEKGGATIVGALKLILPNAKVVEVDMTAVKPHVGPQGGPGQPGQPGHEGHDHGHEGHEGHDHEGHEGHDHAPPTPAPNPAPTPAPPAPPAPKGETP